MVQSRSSLLNVNLWLKLVGMQCWDDRLLVNGLLLIKVIFIRKSIVLLLHLLVNHDRVLVQLGRVRTIFALFDLAQHRFDLYFFTKSYKSRIGVERWKWNESRSAEGLRKHGHPRRGRQGPGQLITRASPSE